MAKKPTTKNFITKPAKPLVTAVSRSVKSNVAIAQPVADSMFRGFIENLPVMFYAVGPEAPHRPIYISPTFEQFGYPLEIWMTDPRIWTKIIHEDDRDRVLEGTRAAIIAGEEIDYEYRIIGESGELFWIRDRSCFIKDKDGRNICWQGVILDVTERKLATGTLKENEARYRQLFENANDIIYVHDLAGNYISVNQAAERIFGYTRDEVLRLNMTEIIAPDHLKLVKRKLSQKLTSRRGQTVYEVDCIVKNGRRLTLEINSSVIVSDGVPIAVQGVARDITDRKLAEERSRKIEERYRDLFENANDLIYTHDMDGRFTSLNRAGEIITGYSREETIEMNIADVVAPEFLKGARTMTAKKVAGDRPTTYELEIIAKDGHRVALELSTRLITQNDLPVGVQGIARDISARRAAENALHNTISLFSSTFESTADGIIVLSLEQEIVTCNKKFLKMWDILPDSAAGTNGVKLIEHMLELLKEPEPFLNNLDGLYSDPLSVMTEIINLKDGRIYERYSQPHFMEGKPVGRVCCFRDITERSQAEAKLRHYALHDTLTDLPNRVSFMNHLRQAVENSSRNNYAQFAVLFLDLDRFKVINDSLGHTVGDKLLIAIAERLRSCVRPGDVVARLGGDEFTILVNRSGDTTEVKKVAMRLQKRISEPFKLDNYEVFTTASIGIVVSGNVKRQAEDFLRDADAAMYRAKEAGKARYEIFDREMHVRNMNLLQIETDLRHAVERGEFEIVYQPIVHLESGNVREFEALIRWRHPVHGLVGPGEFISVAEETGLIVPIGRWIIEESCRQLVKWQAKHNFLLSISVNLSAKQLMHPSLVGQVTSILNETGLDPRQLKLEVTESNVMEHSERALAVLNDLHALGISLSTDDFGTGYSSLSYLQRFPFDRLKIDRSFIDKMDGDEKSVAIVKTILMLGENLGIEVVAEGIETSGQLEMLCGLGCRLGQGFLFSKPVGSLLVEKLLSCNAGTFDLAGNGSNHHIPVIDTPDSAPIN